MPLAAILILARGVHAASTSASAGSLETFKNGPVSGCRSDLKVALRIKMRIAVPLASPLDVPGVEWKTPTMTTVTSDDKQRIRWGDIGP
jgi:hypothetical protein